MIFNNLSDIERIVKNYGFELEKGYESDITSYYVNYEHYSVARVWMHNRLKQYKIYYEEPIKNYEHLEFCDDEKFESYLRIVIQNKKKEKLQKKLAAIRKDFI